MQQRNSGPSAPKVSEQTAVNDIGVIPVSNEVVTTWTLVRNLRSLSKIYLNKCSSLGEGMQQNWHRNCLLAQ
jgi:hypothetical protein